MVAEDSRLTQIAQGGRDAKGVLDTLATGVNRNYPDSTLRLSDREMTSIDYAKRVLAPFAVSDNDLLLGAGYHRIVDDLLDLEGVKPTPNSLDAAVLIGADASIAARIADRHELALWHNILKYVKGEVLLGQMRPELQTFYRIAGKVEGLVPREENFELYQLFAAVYAAERANDAGREVSPEELVRVANDRGGRSLLGLSLLIPPIRDDYASQHNGVSPQSKSGLLYQVGSLIQGVDDLRDVAEDRRLGIKTPATLGQYSFPDLEEQYKQLMEAINSAYDPKKVSETFLSTLLRSSLNKS